MGFSNRKSAESCNISGKTPLYMRHRLPDAIREYQGMAKCLVSLRWMKPFYPKHLRAIINRMVLKCLGSLVSVVKKLKSVVLQRTSMYFNSH